MKALLRMGLPWLFFVQLSLCGFGQSGIIATYVGPDLPVNGALATTQVIDFPRGVAADGRLSIVAGSGPSGFGIDGGANGHCR